MGRPWCGGGLFSKALSALLPDGSKIIAVDKDAKALQGITLPNPKVVLETHAGDFNGGDLSLKNLDGVLMANALHFVGPKKLFLKQLKKILKPSGRVIVIEYDMNQPNEWVPYPLSFKELEKLVREAGFESTLWLGETPSLYSRANIYAALVR
ncbi:MAG TPA: class I SAM-dependent methyltransferase [Ohtaekwangia sp.]|nr:class I SAM-dependent methyltransferase [Ohtaekwangia sp.]